MQNEIEGVSVEQLGKAWVGTYTHYEGKHVAVVTAEACDPALAKAAAIRFVQGPSDDARYAWGPHPRYPGRCGVFRLTKLASTLVEEPV